MKITFDRGESEINNAERGLPFERAAHFEFESATYFIDTRHDYGEARIVGVGYLDGRLHVMCFVETGTGIRVISLRKANAREAKRYGKTKTTDEWRGRSPRAGRERLREVRTFFKTSGTPEFKDRRAQTRPATDANKTAHHDPIVARHAGTVPQDRQRLANADRLRVAGLAEVEFTRQAFAPGTHQIKPPQFGCGGLLKRYDEN